jgi:hypothetical protein
MAPLLELRAEAALRAKRTHPQEFESKAHVKLWRASSLLILEGVRSGPCRDESPSLTDVKKAPRGRLWLLTTIT